MATKNMASASVSLHSLRFQLANRYTRRSDPESGAVYKQRREGLQVSLCTTVTSSAKTPIGWRPCKYWRGLRKCDTKDLKRERNSCDEGRPPHTRNPVQKKSATYGREGISCRLADPVSVRQNSKELKRIIKKAMLLNVTGARIMYRNVDVVCKMACVGSVTKYAAGAAGHVCLEACRLPDIFAGRPQPCVQ